MKSAHPAQLLQTDVEHASGLARDADSESTLRGYRSDILDFVEFAKARQLDPRRADMRAVVAYLGHLERTGKSVSTIRRRIAALGRLARDERQPRPLDHAEVRLVLRGIARRHATAGKRPKQKRALTPMIVRVWLEAADVRLRDKALVAVGFVTGLRRSELVALEWADVEETGRGLVIRLTRSKSDQQGDGAVVAVPYGEVPRLCPARVLLRWRRECGAARKRLRSVFGISASTVNRIVKRAAALAGHDPVYFGAHSLRAGLCTAAGEAGVALTESMRASRHRDPVVAASYFRPSDALTNKAYAAAVRSIVS